MQRKRLFCCMMAVFILACLLAIPALAASGDVSGAILVIAFFMKTGAAYFDYRKHGQFEWTAPAILLACLIFTLTAPSYIWGIVGM